jgi:hypothetical protein
MCILYWAKNWLDVLLVHEGITIVVQIFEEIPQKFKNMLLCNTLIVKKSPLSGITLIKVMHVWIGLDMILSMRYYIDEIK